MFLSRVIRTTPLATRQMFSGTGTLYVDTPNYPWGAPSDGITLDFSISTGIGITGQANAAKIEAGLTNLLPRATMLDVVNRCFNMVNQNRDFNIGFTKAYWLSLLFPDTTTTVGTYTHKVRDSVNSNFNNFVNLNPSASTELLLASQGLSNFAADKSLLEGILANAFTVYANGVKVNQPLASIKLTRGVRYRLTCGSAEYNNSSMFREMVDKVRSEHAKLVAANNPVAKMYDKNMGMQPYLPFCYIGNTSRHLINNDVKYREIGFLFNCMDNIHLTANKGLHIAINMENDVDINGLFGNTVAATAENVLTNFSVNGRGAYAFDSIRTSGLNSCQYIDNLKVTNKVPYFTLHNLESIHAEKPVFHMNFDSNLHGSRLSIEYDYKHYFLKKDSAGKLIPINIASVTSPTTIGSLIGDLFGVVDHVGMGITSKFAIPFEYVEALTTVSLPFTLSPLLGFHSNKYYDLAAATNLDFALSNYHCVLRFGRHTSTNRNATYDKVVTDGELAFFNYTNVDWIRANSGGLPSLFPSFNNTYFMFRSLSVVIARSRVRVGPTPLLMVRVPPRNSYTVSTINYDINILETDTQILHLARVINCGRYNSLTATNRYSNYCRLYHKDIDGIHLPSTSKVKRLVSVINPFLTNLDSEFNKTNPTNTYSREGISELSEFSTTGMSIMNIPYAVNYYPEYHGTLSLTTAAVNMTYKQEVLYRFIAGSGETELFLRLVTYRNYRELYPPNYTPVSDADRVLKELVSLPSVDIPPTAKTLAHLTLVGNSYGLIVICVDEDYVIENRRTFSRYQVYNSSGVLETINVEFKPENVLDLTHNQATEVDIVFCKKANFDILSNTKRNSSRASLLPVLEALPKVVHLNSFTNCFKEPTYFDNRRYPIRLHGVQMDAESINKQALHQQNKNLWLSKLTTT